MKIGFALLFPIVLIPHFRTKLRHYWRSRGFTQLELLIIVFIIGIMATISLPSFGGMLEAARAKQAAVEVRSAFQQTQRQSIRGKSACTADIDIPDISVSSPVIRGNCMSSGNIEFPEGIALATNVLPEAVTTIDDSDDSDETSFNPWEQKIHRANILQIAYCFLFPSECRADMPLGLEKKEVSIKFGRLGAAKFEVAQSSSAGTSQEYSAKFVSVRPNKPEAKKPCVVLSGSLGLTRIGTYHGDLDPLSISTEGTCQADHWTNQK